MTARYLVFTTTVIAAASVVAFYYIYSIRSDARKAKPRRGGGGLSTDGGNPEFERAALRSKCLPADDLPNSTKLELYGLYKASTMKDAPDPREAPSVLDLVGRAKFEAWSEASRRFPRPDEAIIAYIDLVNRTCIEYGIGEDGGGGGTQPPPSKPRGMRSVSKMTTTTPEVVDEPLSSSEYQKAKRMFEECVDEDRSRDLESLLTSNPDASRERDCDGRTLLHWAVDSSSLWAVKTLVERHGADIEAKDSEGSTPLIYAAMGDLVETARYLLGRGADVKAKTTTMEGGDFASLASRGMLQQLASPLP